MAQVDGNLPHETFFPMVNTIVANDSWWKHDMETLSRLLALCEVNPPAIGRFPSQSASYADL